MTKKTIKEKLKSQKGITGADVLIALMLILTTISTIGMIYLNIKTISRITNAKTGATRIATNIIENAKGAFFDDVQNFESSDIDTEQTVLNTKIPRGYYVTVEVEPLQNDEYNITKKINVTVQYNRNDSNNVVKLSTILEREKIRECNSPNFSEEYIREIVGEGNDYQIFENYNLIDYGKKIVCPVKYNGDNYCILNGDEINNIWYSYIDKQWARVVVFDNYTELQEYVDMSSNCIIDLSILKDENKSFVWIPRYKIDETVNPNKVYFMYKDTQYAIKKSTGDDIYYYINVSDEVLNNRLTPYFVESSGNSPGFGKWFSYSYIKNLSSQDNEIVKKLYESEYGPLFEF